MAKSGKGEKDGNANPMWGGRFASAPDALMQEINASIDIDKRLWREDIEGSKAHAAMLSHQGIIPQADAAAIERALHEIAREIEAGRFTFSRALEDIHLNIEARLTELAGDAGRRVHTARSRNDQVATDFRLWVREGLDRLHAQIVELQRALVDKAEGHADAIMPGFTHMQVAQPITFGHHMLAYVEMLSRDASRVSDARARMNESPLGAAALAGTSFPIDRDMTAKALHFDRPMANSIDAVSARDFALEALSCTAILATHLSRLAEEIVLWLSPSFGFARLSDKFTTGSSIMPQKRNPDAAELVRAKAGRIFGSLTALLTVIKGLPLAYAKDLQEDKALTFEAFDAAELALAAMTGMIRDLTINAAAMRAAASAGHSTATDLADWLVREAGLPFREAHHATGRIVAAADAKECALAELSLADMQKIEPKITKDIFSVLTVEASVASRRSYGGTASELVRQQAAEWKARLK
ncbi:MAG TPA: argininosuccinate lyase [Alphaproteobacteria bacterium]|nr:argininosuccinate lyase [Alphaproteobacteria bacterium]